MKPSPRSDADRRALTWAMRLSLFLGLTMFVIKMGAYLLTDSAAILSDAAESVVHIAAVAFATYSLRLSYRPADPCHLYGHTKIAFFSAGFEGAMIFLAALYILYVSIHKWIVGIHLENLGLGTALTAVAAVINGSLGFYLLRVGRTRKSLILEANGRHVLTDCWTSLAVLVGLGLTLTTGWLPFDPICGLAMGLNILVSGARLMRAAFVGLMDSAEPGVQQRLVDILDRETAKHGLAYHQLRHRNVGDAHWVEVHLLFPPGQQLEEAHRTATAIELAIEQSLEPQVQIITHLECQTDHDVLHVHSADRPQSS